MNIPYTCKFCKHEGIVTIEDDYPKDMIHLDKWIPMICCKRCADYMDGKRKLTDSIRRICISLEAARMTMDEEKARGTETKLRMILERITKKFCGVICDYHRRSNLWDMEFVNLLAEKPEKWFNIVNHYIRGIANMPREHRQSSLPHAD